MIGRGTFSAKDQEILNAIKKNNIESLKKLVDEDDVNRQLQPTNDCDPHVLNDVGKTLLGLAAFYGSLEVVKYLVEKKGTDVNAPSVLGNTPLHEVLYGDKYPFNEDGELHWNTTATNHGEIARYLLAHGGNLRLLNLEGNTPYDDSQWCAPYWIENFVGYRFFTNTGSAMYYGNQVRPVFNEHLGLPYYEAHAGSFNCTLL